MADSKFLTTTPKLDTATLARIFTKVVVDVATGCWLWTGARDRHGYGYVRYKGRVVFCHRLMFAWLVCPLPCGGRRGNNPVLDHFDCDRPSCCNPAHLRLVSHAENVMRGNGVGAKSARRTHCPRGHELPPRPDVGPRRCAICLPLLQHAAYERRRDSISRDDHLARLAVRREQRARRIHGG